MPRQTLSLISLIGCALISYTAMARDNQQLSCILEPSQTIEISSHVPGIVNRINIERGDEVKKGQLLLALESGLEQAALNSVKARAEFSQRKLERNSRLLKQGLLSEYERDELLTDRQLAELAIKESEQLLQQRQIHSPIDGIVVERYASVGEYVAADPVMELVSLDPLHAEIILRAELYGTLKPGMPVTIMVGSDNRPYQGKITIIDKVIDPASGTYGVRVELPNRDAGLPAGLKCQARLTVQ